MIEHLPLLLPDSARSDRTRTRCHKKLARLRTRPSSRFSAERAVLLGFGAIYLSSVALSVLQILIR